MDSFNFEDFNEIHKNIYSSLPKGFSETVEAFAMNYCSEITKCSECSKFLVQMAKKTCCTACFVRWKNGFIGLQAIICFECRKSIKELMNGGEVKILCDLIVFSIKEKNPGPVEHYTNGRFEKVAKELKEIIWANRLSHY